MRASGVIKRRCGRAKENNRRRGESGKRAFISLDETGIGAGKEPTQRLWPPKSRRFLPRVAHVSGLVRICRLARKRENSRSCCVCEHLIWNSALIRVWTFIGLCFIHVNMLSETSRQDARQDGQTSLTSLSELDSRRGTVSSSVCQFTIPDRSFILRQSRVCARTPSSRRFWQMRMCVL